MEIKITAKQTLNVLLILSWIIFVGLSIEASGFIVNAIFSIVRPDVVSRLYRQVDLSALLKYDHGHFFVMTFIMGIVAVMKAWLFYEIIKIIQSRDLNISQPFSKKVRRFIFCLSYAAFLISLFSWYGVKYAGWLIEQGVGMPDTQQLRLGGADVWLFMAVVLFIIAQIFKRGIELQSENELTI